MVKSLIEWIDLATVVLFAGNGYDPKLDFEKVSQLSLKKGFATLNNGALRAFR